MKAKPLPSPAATSFAQLMASHGHSYGVPCAHQPAKFQLDTSYPFVGQLSHMFLLQNRMNTDTAPHWRTAGFNWTRAVMVESVEGLCHYDSWKWWKKGKPDVKQAVLELVDTWHFYLSWFMVRFERFGHTDETLLTAVVRRFVKAAHAVSLKPAPKDKAEAVNLAFERLAGAAVQGVPNLEAFVELCLLLDMGLEDLYRGYLQKNLLNFFRQKYGYKTGRYLKEWKDGLEDNIYLERAYLRVTKDLDFSKASAVEELEALLGAELLKDYTEACEGISCLDIEGQAPILGRLESATKFVTLDKKDVQVCATDKVRSLPIAEK